MSANDVPQVNERSTAYLSVTFRDKTQQPSMPVSASYRVHDQSTGQQIRAATTLAPAESVEITLTPADNTILSPSKAFEAHVVTVEALYGAEDAHREQFVYQVRNLQVIA